MSKSPPDVSPRAITKFHRTHEASEGIGAKVRRFVGNHNVRCLPPFVVCEQFKINETGRPPHPARGAQKITYVLNGKVRIGYSPNNVIDLLPGDVTSLMVGKGVIRSVKAVPLDNNDNAKARASGIQVFMDVPESLKRRDPSHLNLNKDDIIMHELSKGAQIKIITGSIFGKKADQMLTTTPALILDCYLEPGASIELPIKSNWNAFAYVIRGHANIQNTRAGRYSFVEFMREHNAEEENELENSVVLKVDESEQESAQILFGAAKPLCQPIYRQGPFVDVSMNWIQQAFSDYSERKNGFETNDWNNHTSRSDCIPITNSRSSSVSSLPPTPMPSKASFPNSFPPGSINPPSHSTEFNGVDCVEKQQESKIPKKRRHSDEFTSSKVLKTEESPSEFSESESERSSYKSSEKEEDNEINLKEKEKGKEKE